MMGNPEKSEENNVLPAVLKVLADQIIAHLSRHQSNVPETDLMARLRELMKGDPELRKENPQEVFANLMKRTREVPVARAEVQQPKANGFDYSKFIGELKAAESTYPTVVETTDLKALLKGIAADFTSKISSNTTDMWLLRFVNEHIECLQNAIKTRSLESNDNLESSREDLTEARDNHSIEIRPYNGMVDNAQITRIQQAVALVGLDESFATTICRALSLRTEQFSQFKNPQQCEHFLDVIFASPNWETQNKLNKLSVVLATCL